MIERIHNSGRQAVLSVTGGGSGAIFELLQVPGASRTVLEAVVPYSWAALSDWLGRAPDRACCDETALTMAAVAWQRAVRLSASQHDAAQTAAAPARARAPAHTAETNSATLSEAPPLTDAAVAEPAHLLGVAATASLVSDRPKRGAHRCWAAVHSLAQTRLAHVELEKGARSRRGEEAVCTALILDLLAEAAGISDRPPLPLLPQETVSREHAAASAALQRLAAAGPAGEPVVRHPDGSEAAPEPSACRGVLCGSFHPLHEGHCRLRQAAEKTLGGPVWFELAVLNADKPPLDWISLSRRLQQFDRTPVVLTAASTFVEKSRVLPDVVFVVGVDTAERILAPRFYGQSEAARNAALQELRNRGCRFLVAGREAPSADASGPPHFRTLNDLSIPPEFADLFAALPESAFRVAASSTNIRTRAGGWNYARESSCSD